MIMANTYTRDSTNRLSGSEQKRCFLWVIAGSSLSPMRAVIQYHFFFFLPFFSDGAIYHWSVLFQMVCCEWVGCGLLPGRPGLRAAMPRQYCCFLLRRRRRRGRRRRRRRRRGGPASAGTGARARTDPCFSCAGVSHADALFQHSAPDCPATPVTWSPSPPRAPIPLPCPRASGL